MVLNFKLLNIKEIKMNMNQVRIKGSDILAIKCFASVNAIRYYLDEVAIMFEAGSVFLAATDGLVLGKIKVGELECEPKVCFLPYGWMKSIKKTDSIVITDGFISMNEAKPVELLDGSIFPDISPMLRRCITKNDEARIGDLHPMQTVKFYKFATMLGFKNIAAIPIFHTNGTEMALVWFKDIPDFHGIIMPLLLKD